MCVYVPVCENNPGVLSGFQTRNLKHVLLNNNSQDHKWELKEQRPASTLSVAGSHLNGHIQIIHGQRITLMLINLHILKIFLTVKNRDILNIKI